MKQYCIDVNIADDHVMLAEGLAETMNLTGKIHVSRFFSTIRECRQALKERQPDVLLLDISMPDGDGMAFFEELAKAYPKMKVIVVTMHDEYSVIRQMIDVGVHGYLLKNSSMAELVDAVQRVWKGGNYISPQVDEILHSTTVHQVSLTKVESSVLRLVCEGLTNPMIAKNLGLSVETVNWYRKRLLAKYGVKNTVGLVKLVLKEKLV